MSATSTEANRGLRTGRVLTLVRELVRGRTLDRQSISKLIAVSPEQADRLMRTLLKHWPELEGHRRGQRREVRWTRIHGALVRDSVAVAACLGASLSQLLEGSSYEAGLRDARANVLSRVRSPPLFANFDRKFYFVKRGGEMMLPEKASILDELVDAVLNQNPVRMRYRRYDGRLDDVRMEPMTIAVCDHQLYIVGRDVRGKYHPYRFGRVDEAEREESTFQYPPKAQYDPDERFEDTFGVFLGEEYPVEWVRLRLSKEWVTYAQYHRWHGSQRIEPGQDHVVVRVRVRVCPEVKAWILGFGEQAEVLEPEGLRVEIAHRLAAAARRYRVEGRPLAKAKPASPGRGKPTGPAKVGAQRERHPHRSRGKAAREPHR